MSWNEYLIFEFMKTTLLAGFTFFFYLQSHGQISESQHKLKVLKQHFDTLRITDKDFKVLGHIYIVYHSGKKGLEKIEVDDGVKDLLETYYLEDFTLLKVNYHGRNNRERFRVNYDTHKAVLTASSAGKAFEKENSPRHYFFEKALLLYKRFYSSIRLHQR